MGRPAFGFALTVAETLAFWPHTIPVFLRHQMSCVGCPMAPFETLAEVVAVYQLDLDLFLEELRQSNEEALKPGGVRHSEDGMRTALDDM